MIQSIQKQPLHTDKLLARSIHPIWGPPGVHNLETAVEEDDNDSGDYHDDWENKIDDISLAIVGNGVVFKVYLQKEGSWLMKT